jgi:transcriptional regulator with XRE-family HTH domain
MMRTEYNHVHKPVNNHVCLTTNKRGCNFARMTYGERLEIAIKHAGLTQAGLAALVGTDEGGKPRVTQANISKLIKQKNITGSKHTAKFARICGISEDWLAYEEGEMVDGLYVHDERIKRALLIMQQMPEYAVDDAIKELDQMAQLIKKATAAAKQ